MGILVYCYSYHFCFWSLHPLIPFQPSFYFSISKVFQSSLQYLQTEHLVWLFLVLYHILVFWYSILLAVKSPDCNLLLFWHFVFLVFLSFYFRVFWYIPFLLFIFLSFRYFFLYFFWFFDSCCLGICLSRTTKFFCFSIRLSFWIFFSKFLFLLLFVLFLFFYLVLFFLFISQFPYF